MTEVFRALEPFSFTSNSGIPRVVRAGDLVSSEDPDLKGREHLFEPAVAAANRAAETASAGPGEKRVRTKPTAPHQPAPEQPKQPESPTGDKS